MNSITNNTLFVFKLVLVSLFYFSSAAAANDQLEVENILASEKSPVGVVFELIGPENGKYLPDGLKKVEAYKTQLSKKFPDIKFAVVTHGAEQFELSKTNALNHSQTHDIVKRITAEDVPVHVCSNHASWRNMSEVDFPNYILASTGAGTQMREYEDQGYTRVTIY